MIRLYALPLSAYCTKVRIVLQTKQIPYTESVPHGGHYTSDSYLQHMPPGTIPAIEDNGFKLFESEAIVEYLEDVFPDYPMRANDPAQRARQRAIAQFHNTRLEPAVRALFPLVKCAAAERDKDDVKRALNALNAALEKLEIIIEPAPFIGGDVPCLADCGYPATLRMGQDIFAALGVEVRFSEKVVCWMHALETHRVIGEEVKKNRQAVAEWMRPFFEGVV